jgi:endonuclease III
MQRHDVPRVYARLKRHYESVASPLAAFQAVRTRDPFRVLVSALLSSRTKDETTTEAVRRLFAAVRTPEDLARLPRRRIERLIYPVGFYHTKAGHLRALPRALRALTGGTVPATVEDLVRLPGVGRKVANLVVAEAFDRPAVCVDVHVHRICNRLGLVRTASPFETEMALRRTLPQRYWKRINAYLVAFGQTVCLPRGPRCGECTIRRWCARRGMARGGAR